MVGNIIEVSGGYRALVDGVEMIIPAITGNRHYKMVLDAIAAGATVDLAEQTPVAPAVLALTPVQWGFFLDLSGFREALDAALAAMPKTTFSERATWAGLRAVSYASEQYRLDLTLALVAQVRDMNLLPPVDIPTDEVITQAFTAAADFQGAASVIGAL